MNRTVIASHYGIDYSAEFVSRPSFPEDPWITWKWWGYNAPNYVSILYGENANGDTPNRVANNYFNVFISLVISSAPLVL